MSSKIYIVGMGPGTGDMMTPQADHALCGSDVIVGYPVYLKLLGGKYREKEFLSTPMKQEVRRCEMCFEEAEKGKTVAMVCSGDAGVYGMASLLYEMSEAHPGGDPRDHSGKQWGSGAWSTTKPRLLRHQLK